MQPSKNIEKAWPYKREGRTRARNWGSASRNGGSYTSLDTSVAKFIALLLIGRDDEIDERYSGPHSNARVTRFEAAMLFLSSPVTSSV